MQLRICCLKLKLKSSFSLSQCAEDKWNQLNDHSWSVCSTVHKWPNIVAEYNRGMIQHSCVSSKDSTKTSTLFFHRHSHFWHSQLYSVLCCQQQFSILTLSPPIPLRLYTLPYWSNPPFLIFDIRAPWRGLSARAPECQKLKMVG